MGSIPTFVHWHLVHLRGYVWSDREVCKLAFKPQSPRISNLPLGYANVNNNKTKREGVDKRRTYGQTKSYGFYLGMIWI